MRARILTLRLARGLALAAGLALIIRGAALGADFNGFDRGSGYEPVEPAYYPELDSIFPERPVETFAGFDEKREAFSNRDDPSKIRFNTDTLYVTVDEYTAGAAHFYLTHVLIRDMQQVSIAQSNDTFGGEREKASDYAKRSGAAVVINGSYFYYETGAPIDVCAPVVIRDSKVVRDGTSNGSELCLRFDGSFFSPHPIMAFSGNDLLNFGVIGVLGTADPLLIQDGTPMSFPNGVRDFSYPRSAIGVVQPGEYYLLTAGDGSYSGGLTYRQMQRIFYDLECTFARSLDGGGSATLVIGGELINSPAEGSERAVVDFLVFTE